MTDADDAEVQQDWWAEPGEVLVKTADYSLWVVSARLVDVDGGDNRYYLWDDTHTVDEFWYEVDLHDTFAKTGVKMLNSDKPKHRLDGRLYDEDWAKRNLRYNNE